MNSLKDSLIKHLTKLQIEITKDIEKTIQVLCETFRMIVRVDRELEEHYNHTNTYLIKGKRHPNLEIRKNLATTFSTYCKLYRDIISKAPVKNTNEDINPLDAFIIKTK